MKLASTRTDSVEDITGRSGVCPGKRQVRSHAHVTSLDDPAGAGGRHVEIDLGNFAGKEIGNHRQLIQFKIRMEHCQQMGRAKWKDHHPRSAVSRISPPRTGWSTNHHYRLVTGGQRSTGLENSPVSEHER